MNAVDAVNAVNAIDFERGGDGPPKGAAAFEPWGPCLLGCNWTRTHEVGSGLGVEGGGAP